VPSGAVELQKTHVVTEHKALEHFSLQGFKASLGQNFPPFMLGSQNVANPANL
jgi:hypothetical protein